MKMKGQAGNNMAHNEYGLVGLNNLPQCVQYKIGGRNAYFCVHAP